MSLVTVDQITPLRLRERAIPRAPEHYEGPLSEFVSRYLEPCLPAVETVRHYHHLLTDYCLVPDPLFLVRGVRGLERGRVYCTSSGQRIKATDNAPAWWVHSILFNGLRIQAESVPAWINAMPCHLFEAFRYPTVNRAGWHVAHLLGAKDGDTDWQAWDHRALVRRFIRNSEDDTLSRHPRVGLAQHENRVLVGRLDQLHRVPYCRSCPNAFFWGRELAMTFSGPGRPLARRVPESVSGLTAKRRPRNCRMSKANSMI